MERVMRRIKHVLLKYKCIFKLICSLLCYILRIRFYVPKVDSSQVDKVLFVAHPDDEILFFSKQLFNEGGWLVVCITNGATPRSKEFVDVMNHLNLKYQIWNFRDGMDVKWNVRRLRKRINKILTSNKWQKIMTHNEDGEYGHYQHKQLHNCVKSLCNNKKLFFPEQEELLMKKENRLTGKVFNMKSEIINKYYRSQEEILLEYFMVWMEYESIVCNRTA